MTRRRREADSNALRVVAVLEAAKGALVLLAGCGALALIHRNLHLAAMELVKVLHLNPAQHYPRIFIDAADRVTDMQLWMLAVSALLYSAIRFVEASGLWLQRSWAEWFGLLSGAIYLPVEIYEVSRELTWPRITVLSVNLAVVALLALAIRRSGRRQER